ncbi:hypothetical protein GCM10010129_63890 [Streptomyces fumigatiscleroticus]|nr:hypothetical protein GCM10010129_63890 [Streptomyces fumigatiscleroticus]
MAVWALAVAAGGGLTLWLQDSARPAQPYGWERQGDGPTPSLPQGWQTLCPPEPTGTAGGTPVRTVCAFSVIR